MTVPLTFCQNYFELFSLPISFSVDLAALNQHFKSLQKEMHPDRFIGHGDHEQRLSVQYAAFLNEAINTLKSPLKRAHYLLKLKGRDVNTEHYTIRDTEFLMQQMVWRERLEEISADTNPSQTMDKLQQDIEDLINQHSEQFKKAYESGDLIIAEETLHKMHFAYKLQSELEAAYDKYDG